MLECDQKFQKQTVYFEQLSARHLTAEGEMESGTCLEVSESSYLVLTTLNTSCYYVMCSRKPMLAITSNIQVCFMPFQLNSSKS